ncbi:TPA: hypothetical protein HA219_02495 [Candidatus Woesearchaeota archaeon]|nr:hypothetical protein [Candidatus Woesearchaeota archaeon]HIH39562.1 hypothetical protein [Candidatus Woesearchaeota archaeon]
MTITEIRKGIKLPKKTLDSLLRSPNPQEVLRLIQNASIGSKIKVICRDNINNVSYTIPGRLTEFKPEGIVIQDNFVPYSCIELYMN